MILLGELQGSSLWKVAARDPGLGLKPASLQMEILWFLHVSKSYWKAWIL